MSSTRASRVTDRNERMGSQGPRGDEPKRRRAFNPSDKFAHLDAYERAVAHGEGGAYLRREGLYSS
ncbi:hypothetical protein OG563_37420 [Nocardia vinacea]|uniref:Uncharacterized protein n=1 Tax=Nocardia vinacea TaxID=96468 RepID=A0ABZ1Z7F5_9NOCA|nr:hypothetical protein [Nocardia vinacea]